jgi:hypothetical protein
MYRVTFLVLLLHLKCNDDAVGEVEAGTVMLYFLAVLDESNISES